MFMKSRRFLALFLVASSLFGCTSGKEGTAVGNSTEPKFLTIASLASGGWRIVSVSPFDGSEDTLDVVKPMDRLIVMSTSHIGFLEAVGCDSAVAGVSGLDYIHGPFAQKAVQRGVADVGYESAPDYEKIMELKPDLLLTYEVTAARSPFIAKLESLGIRVLAVHEHLEHHPLARASYIRLFGALTGNMHAADSVLSSVRTNYLTLADSVSSGSPARRKVLLNIPYNDRWFIPGKDNYLTHLIEDAGGEVLGSESNRTESSVISLEKAYSLGKEADCWLNVGWCRSLDQLVGVNPIFEDMLENIRDNASARGYGADFPVWNDDARLSPKGGNDIWQSGVVRPDLVLRDLARIFGCDPDSPVYYRKLLKDNVEIEGGTVAPCRGDPRG